MGTTVTAAVAAGTSYGRRVTMATRRRWLTEARGRCGGGSRDNGSGDGSDGGGRRRRQQVEVVVDDQQAYPAASAGRTMHVVGGSER